MADPSQPPPHRYVTTENIRPGDVILEEEAWIWSFLDLGSAKLTCNYCFKLSKPLKACSACKSAFYCDATCQRNDWILRHKHECQNLKTIRQMAQKTPGAVMLGSKEIHFNVLIPCLLLSAAEGRLFHAGERDENGNPTSPLWKKFMQTPYKADLIDLGRQPKLLKSAVCRSIIRQEPMEPFIQNRFLPSLVVLSNNEPWKKALANVIYTKQVLEMPQQLALGACFQMSKYPHTCDRPNAITINDGRIVRMIAMENIENLDAVRLTRLPAWLYEHRFSRRTAQLYKFFGYGCFCSRCKAGDTAAETTLFALRCPQHACNGIVKGLRRTDIKEYDYDTSTGKPELDEDEPRPLSFQATQAPPHERAVCMQCNAKYDAKTMKSKILPLLQHMERGGLPAILISPDSIMADEDVCKVLEAEKYMYPTNYLFLKAKRTLLGRIMMAASLGFPDLHPGAAVWLKNYLREVLARVEAAGCQQIDLRGLQEIVENYGCYVEIARKSGCAVHGLGMNSAAKFDAQTRLGFCLKRLSILRRS